MTDPRPIELEAMEHATRYGRGFEDYATEAAHDRDDQLAVRDRLAERAPHAFEHLAYVERPSDRERREHYDETRARRDLYKRRPDSQVGYQHPTRRAA